MKTNSIILLCALSTASAFTPAAPRAFVSKNVPTSTAIYAEETAEAKPAAPEPESKPAAAAASEESSIVPITKEEIEFSAGVVGGIGGLVVGGPVLGAITAAATNYVSKDDSDIGKTVQGVSKTSIEFYRQAETFLGSSLVKIKDSGNVDPDTVKNIEGALAKAKEINEQYDIVGAGKTAFGVVGDLVERAVEQAKIINEEYKLTDKAQDAVKDVVDKAKTSVDKK